MHTIIITLGIDRSGYSLLWFTTYLYSINIFYSIIFLILYRRTPVYIPIYLAIHNAQSISTNIIMKSCKPKLKIEIDLDYEQF